MMENNMVKSIVMGILFFVFLAMIIIAQRTVSVVNLGIELVGLAGLLTLLYIYNKKYK